MIESGPSSRSVRTHRTIGKLATPLLGLPDRVERRAVISILVKPATRLAGRLTGYGFVCHRTNTESAGKVCTQDQSRLQDGHSPALQLDDLSTLYFGFLLTMMKFDSKNRAR